ncbi:hypothetical protein L6452_32327 [Arctium lappa]|uniref:Uncharacterized protein n=1 Tax=Arctium lappa TaxID=4217 RepID=A0ACB8Z465_ARCLA|nr:hypothetical protein L6452_32327 [Arctium lappa]
MPIILVVSCPLVVVSFDKAKSSTKKCVSHALPIASKTSHFRLVNGPDPISRLNIFTFFLPQNPLSQPETSVTLFPSNSLFFFSILGFSLFSSLRDSPSTKLPSQTR